MKECKRWRDHKWTKGRIVRKKMFSIRRVVKCRKCGVKAHLVSKR